VLNVIIEVEEVISCLVSAPRGDMATDVNMEAEEQTAQDETPGKQEGEQEEELGFVETEQASEAKLLQYFLSQMDDYTPAVCDVTGATAMLRGRLRVTHVVARVDVPELQCLSLNLLEALQGCKMA
jgi:hypothetical protein